jgi:hypothetical protein
MTVERLDADPAVGVVFTNLYYDAGGRSSVRPCALPGGRHDDLLPEIIRANPVQASATLMRREVWEEGERRYPLANASVGDLTMWVRSAIAGWAFHYVDEPLVAYAVHPGQLSFDRVFGAERTVKYFGSFSFEDADTERLRRARLAEALMARAHVRFTHGRIRSGVRDVASARRVAPGGVGRRGWIALTGVRIRSARFVAARPGLLPPAVRLWRRLQPVDRLR